jgi:hypothetical protein
MPLSHHCVLLIPILRGTLVDFDEHFVDAQACKPATGDVDVHLAGDDVFT